VMFDRTVMWRRSENEGTQTMRRMSSAIGKAERRTNRPNRVNVKIKKAEQAPGTQKKGRGRSERKVERRLAEPR
jgi:hypothetical protein